MAKGKSAKLSNLDIVVLERFKQADDGRLPAPPAFVDNLARLSRAGFISATDNAIAITDHGRKFLMGRTETAEQS